MIRFEVQVLVGVGWFSVHGDMSTAVVIDVYTGVQEGEDPVAFWFGCENDVRVNTVDMSCELLYVVFMDLGDRVIHVPEPQGWRVRCSAQSSFFEHLHVQVGNDGIRPARDLQQNSTCQCHTWSQSSDERSPSPDDRGSCQ